MLAKFLEWLAGYRQHIALAVTFMLVAAGFFAIGYAVASQQAAPQPVNVGQIVSHKQASISTLGFSQPLAINLPTINVNSQLISVGKNPNGTIAIPKGNQRNHAAWYKHSVAPGQKGAAVIEGHLDTYSGPSVFFNLGKLKLGDKIFITRADGKRLTFQVTAVREYFKTMFPTDEVYDADGSGAELHLVTCAGDFDQSTDSYVKNLVVYSQLVAVS